MLMLKLKVMLKFSVLSISYTILLHYSLKKIPDYSQIEI